MSDKKQIKISEILSMLEGGKSRKDIAAHLEIPMSQLKRIFEHEKLVGKKARPSVNWELIDDTVVEEAGNSPVNVETTDNVEATANATEEAQY